MKPQKSLFVNLYYTCISLTLRSPPDGASSNHEDRLATPITNSASAPADPAPADPESAADIQTDIQSQSQSEGGSGRSSPCIMYSVESGEEGRTSGEEQTSPHHLTDHTQSQSGSLDITTREDNSDTQNEQYVLLKTRIFVMVMNLFLCFFRYELLIA